MHRRRRLLRSPFHAMSDLPCTLSHSVPDQPPDPARRQLEQRNHICSRSGQLSMHDLSFCAKAPLCTHSWRNAVCLFTHFQAVHAGSLTLCQASSSLNAQTASGRKPHLVAHCQAMRARPHAELDKFFPPSTDDTGKKSFLLTRY